MGLTLLALQRHRCQIAAADVLLQPSIQCADQSR